MVFIKEKVLSSKEYAEKFLIEEMVEMVALQEELDKQFDRIYKSYKDYSIFDNDEEYLNCFKHDFENYINNRKIVLNTVVNNDIEYDSLMNEIRG